VCPKIAIIYNAPEPKLYETDVEKRASLTIIESVEAVQRALIESGYLVILVPLLPPLDSAKDILRKLETDLVFNLFEGFDGYPETEPDITKFISELGLNYTGCTGIALSFGLDKINTKAHLTAMGSETPRYQLLGPKTVSLFHLRYPCIVKPYADDGSNGISEESVVHDLASLEKQVNVIHNLFGKRALV